MSNNNIIEQDDRRPLFKREPLVTPVAIPKPYTTLNQNVNERTNLNPENFALSAPAPEAVAASSLNTTLIQNGLKSIADQVSSAENEAQMSERANELAQVASTAAQLKKSLKNWRAQETDDVDKQINDALAQQGITKKQLQNNAKLRQTVTAWKQKIYAQLNANLNTNEKKAIADQQSALNSAIAANRSSLNSNISSYESKVKAAITPVASSVPNVSVAEPTVPNPVYTSSTSSSSAPAPSTTNTIAQQEQAIMDQYQFKGTWAQFQDWLQNQQIMTAETNAYAGTQNMYIYQMNQKVKIYNNLLSSGVISASGGTITLKKPLANLTTQDIANLDTIGFNISQSMVDQAKYIQSHQAENAEGNTLAGIQDIANLVEINRAKNQQSIITSLANQGVVKVSGGNVTLLKPLGGLTSSQITQLSNAGFDVNAIKQQTMKDAGFSGTWTQFVNQQSNALAQTKNLAALQAAGLIDVSGGEAVVSKPLPSLSSSDIKLLNNSGFNITSQQVQQAKIQQQQQEAINQLSLAGVVSVAGNKVTVTKPVTALSDKDIALLATAGINVPKLPKGPNETAYEAAVNMPSSQVGIGSKKTGLENIAAIEGTMLNDAANAYNLLIASWTGLPKEEFRGPTVDTLKYYTTVSPTRQVALDIGATIAETGAGYLAMLPVGFTAKGAQLVAGNIAEKISVSAPEAVSKISAYIISHPKVAQALVWAPIAGMSAVDIYQQAKAGVSPETILANTARQIAGMYGSVKGFEAGFNALTPNQMVEFRQATKIERVKAPDGTFTYQMTVDTKKLPSDVADILKSEIGSPAPNGKTVIAGIGNVEGVKVPMTLEANNGVLQDLIAGEKLGPEYVKGAILNYVKPEDYGLLKSKFPELENMSPQEITNILYKEIGPESPFAEGIRTERTVLTGTEPFSMDIKAAYVDAGNGTDALKWGHIDDIYNKLRSYGVDESKAAYLSSKILSEDMDTVSGILKSLKLSSDQTAELAALRFEAGGPSRGATAIYRSLKEANIPDSDIQKVIELTAQSSENPSVLASGVPKLSDSGLKALVEMTPQQTLDELGLSLAPEQITRLIDVMAPESAATFISALPASAIAGVASAIESDAIVKVIPYISSDSLLTFIPKLSSAPLTSVITKLTPTQINRLIPRLGTDALTSIGPNLTPQALTRMMPSLTPDQLTSLIPTLTTSSMSEIIPQLSPDVLSAIIPLMSPDQVSVLIPKLSQPQLSGVMERLDIPLDALPKYLETGDVPSTSTLTPPLLKHLFDQTIKEKEIAMQQQKPSYYKVTLFYFMSRETFKVKAKNYKDASSSAMQRRTQSSVPISIVIKKTIQ